jgi:hypothetical protein
MRLFGYITVFTYDVRDDEEEVSNVKHMRVAKEEVPVP